MPVLRALLYLRLTTLRNRVGSQVRRLRQPKYLFGAVASAAYFWFFLFSAARNGQTGSGQAFATMGAPGTVEVIVAVVLTLFIALIWATPGNTAGLAFTEAEVAFLFPAPFTRRQLIHYKLLDGLLMSLLGALFFMILAGGWRYGVIGALAKLAAWWSLNANLMLQHIVAALAISRLARLGFSAVWRRGAIIAGLGTALLVIGAVVHQSGTTALAWLLWPARLAVGPFFAESAGSYLLALAPAAGLVALQYLVIFRMEAPFEEDSIALAQKRGESLARMRDGKLFSHSGQGKARTAPFRLGDHLPVEAAFLWKNLLAAPAYCNQKVFLVVAVLIGAGLTWLKSRADFDGPIIALVLAAISLALLVYLLVFGPQVARNDLRGDLANADMLKAYPVSGWRMVLGSLLAPTVIMTALAWLLLLVIALGFAPRQGRMPWLTPELRFTAALALAVIMPALVAVQLLVPNAATLLFPAWAQTSRNLSGGMDVLGQRLILFAGQLICLVAALLPAFLLGGATIFLTQWLIGLPAAIALAVVPVLGTFALELWVGVWFLGPRFEQLDISSELRP